jgi:phospholipase/carboxylesterase
MSLLDSPAPARVVEGGAARGAAQRAGVLIHGRDRTPEEMIGLAAGLKLDQVRWLAPTVEGGSWYPGRFFDPIAANAPHI